MLRKICLILTLLSSLYQLGQTAEAISENENNRIDVLRAELALAEDLEIYWESVADLMSQSAMQRDLEEVGELSAHWLLNNQLKPEVGAYANATLQDLSGSLIITDTDEATDYFLAYAQARPEVEVFDLRWVSHPELNQALWKLQGLASNASAVDIIHRFREVFPEKEVHLSLTLSPDILSQLKSETFLTGLTLTFVSESQAIDRLISITATWVNRDGLPSAKEYEQNMLPALITAYRIQVSEGKQRKAEKLEEVGKAILERVQLPYRWEDIVTTP